MKGDIEGLNHDACTAHHLASSDTMDVLNGKSTSSAHTALLPSGYWNIKGTIDGITAKMLSKELLDMEMNGLVSQTVLNTKPITVEYDLTDHGHSLKPIIESIVDWG